MYSILQKKIMTYAKSDDLIELVKWLENKIDELEKPVQPDPQHEADPFF